MSAYCPKCKQGEVINPVCRSCVTNITDGVVGIPSNFDPIDEQYPLTKLERHAAICSELNELYKRKNADYGDSFHKTFLEEGMAMPRIRLSDKLERFKRLSKSGEQNVKDESIRDTLIDLANYAIMTILELESEN